MASSAPLAATAPGLAPGIAAAMQSIRRSSSASPSTATAPTVGTSALPDVRSREPSSSLSPPPQSPSPSASATAIEGDAPVAANAAAAAEGTAQDQVREVELDENGKPKKEKKPRKPRKKKVKEPIVYDIPDVEKKTTTFRGRLGYACLNTILRKEEKPSVFCSRTCRIDTIKKEGMDYLKEIGRQNAIDLKKLIEWNAKHHIFFMRVSSELFPFASHEEYGYSLEYAAEELAAAGAAAKEHNMRLTTHPGQFTQLGSPTAKTVRNAVRDLEYHCEMLDRIGLGRDSVMIIHGGGVYGDKAAAIERFKKEYAKLSDGVKDRLVLENDEICYSVDDLMPICEELNIPLVFDYHHDWINPSSQPPAELMPRILATWERKGIRCKQHLSEPRRGAVTIMERRAHADRCQSLPEALPDDVDLMIEAKDKEQAVFHLYRIYDLHPTIHDSLRPPALEETTQTAGRKGNKRAKALRDKAKAEAEAAEGGEAEGEGEGLEDPEADVFEDVKDEAGGLDGTARLEGQGEQVMAPPSASKKRKRMTKKEKEAMEAAAAAGNQGAGDKVKDEGEGVDPDAAAATPSSPPPPKKKAKRMTKKEKEALATASGAQDVQVGDGLGSATGDATPTATTPAAAPAPKKKRMTKKQKEAEAAAAAVQEQLEAANVEAQSGQTATDGQDEQDTAMDGILEGDNAAAESTATMPPPPITASLRSEHDELSIKAEHSETTAHFNTGAGQPGKKLEVGENGAAIDAAMLGQA